jgi:hypothetical protein
MRTLSVSFAAAGASANILSSMYIPITAQTIKNIEIPNSSTIFFNIRNSPLGYANGDKID